MHFIYLFLKICFGINLDIRNYAYLLSLDDDWRPGQMNCGWAKFHLLIR